MTFEEILDQAVAPVQCVTMGIRQEAAFVTTVALS